MHLNPIQTVLCITVDGIIGVVTLPFVSSFTDFYFFCIVIFKPKMPQRKYNLHNLFTDFCLMLKH